MWVFNTMRLFIAFLFLSACLHGQESKISIKAGGETIIYNIKRCYKKGKLVRAKSGLKFKIVVYGGYAPWSKGYSLIVRSIGGRYSLNRQLDNLTDNIEINFDE